jgi:ribosomal protein S6--L-glutamate ligase
MTSEKESASLTCQLKKEYELIYSRIDDEEKPIFEKFFSFYETTDEIRTLFIRYRHFLTDIYNPEWGTQVYEPLKRPIKIGYLLNSDKVFFNELDDVICNYLRNEGAQVDQIEYKDLQIRLSNGNLQLYVKSQPVQFDAFLSYGYRTKLNTDNYQILVKLMEQKGIVTLNSHYEEILLNNKMLQSTHFAKSNIPIPSTYQVFDVSSARDLAYSDLNGSTVIKYLNDYGGDGVFKVEDKWNVFNSVAKNLWKGENVLLQKMIPDSIGESIRVLCIEGEAFAIMKYEDKSGDFRSNVSMGNKFRCVSLMENEKFNLYKEVSEKAIKSIGDILIGGVDLLDSERDGIVVLEVNGFPDLFDIWLHTKRCALKRFAQAFLNRIKSSISK